MEQAPRILPPGGAPPPADQRAQEKSKAVSAAAMETNKGSTLVFEEPEAHAFPYYTKQMGEEIGLESDNQYFIATHNPYLLCAILEKADKTDVAVFVTYFRDFETRVKQLTEDQLSEMLGGDPFYMSRRFVEEAQ